MGRRKISEKNRRKVQVNIRLTDEEFEKITTHSTGSALSPANWIRKKVFTGKFPPPKISPIDAAAIQELRRIGVNLNQAMHKVNEGLLSSALFLTLVELKKKINDLINLVIDDSKPD
jgi:hypothetical protein